MSYKILQRTVQNVFQASDLSGGLEGVKSTF